MKKTAVLLINLGTPDSPQDRDVKRYLTEFLTDPRVIDIPWLPRQILVRRTIVPNRYKESAATYREIWTDEGSPLLKWGEKTASLLQQQLGNDFIVRLVMRYQNPSLSWEMASLKKQGIEKLIVLPLFPQYASATTGSVHQKVMECLSKWPVIPETYFINSYPDHPKLLQAFAARGKEHNLDEYDHILFSFHGLPKKQLIKCSTTGYCKADTSCCQRQVPENALCYSAQCYRTALGIAQELQIQNYSISFQSRLGKNPWVEPYTSDVIKERAAKGDQRLLIFCPAFICDCLETLYEIGIEYQEEFVEAGGKSVTLVEGLNDHPLWIDCLANLVLNQQSDSVVV